MREQIQRRKHLQTVLWCGDVRKRENLDDPSAEVKIILKWIFKNWDGA